MLLGLGQILGPRPSSPDGHLGVGHPPGVSGSCEWAVAAPPWSTPDRTTASPHSQAQLGGVSPPLPASPQQPWLGQSEETTPHGAGGKGIGQLGLGQEGEVTWPGGGHLSSLGDSPLKELARGSLESRMPCPLGCPRLVSSELPWGCCPAGTSLCTREGWTRLGSPCRPSRTRWWVVW